MILQDGKMFFFFSGDAAGLRSTFLVINCLRDMFNLFKKDPVAKLEKKHAALLKEAMNIQRSGDIKAYARKMGEAEEVAIEIEKLRA